MSVLDPQFSSNAASSPASSLASSPTWSRRRALGTLAAGGLSGAALMGAPWVRAAGGKKLTLSWSGTALCLLPVVVARDRGFFEKNQVDVDVINFSGSTDQVLESLATGKADVSLGLIHSWLKPLESGFDVKVVGAAHAGCIRVLSGQDSKLSSVDKLKGAVIGVGQPNGFGRQFMSTYLARKGINPDTEVEWKTYPPDTLDVAYKKGEINLIVDADPNLFLIERRNPGQFREIASILTGDFKDRLCCLIAARGALVRENRPQVAAVVRSLTQAALFIAENPGEAAKVALSYLPQKVTAADIRSILTAQLDYRHHPQGVALRNEIEQYAADLKNVGVLKKSTDPARFANFLTVDVLA